MSQATQTTGDASTFEQAQAIRADYQIDGPHVFDGDDNLVGTTTRSIVRQLDDLDDEIEHFSALDDAEAEVEVEYVKTQYVRLARKLGGAGQ